MKKIKLLFFAFFAITTMSFGQVKVLIDNIIIQGSELQAGMYMYTLLIDNTIVDTKKMILTK